MVGGDIMFHGARAFSGSRPRSAGSSHACVFLDHVSTVSTHDSTIVTPFKHTCHTIMTRLQHYCNTIVISHACVFLDNVSTVSTHSQWGDVRFVNFYKRYCILRRKPDLYITSLHFQFTYFDITGAFCRRLGCALSTLCGCWHKWNSR
jgi:hypothetical protein